MPCDDGDDGDFVIRGEDGNLKRGNACTQSSLQESVCSEIVLHAELQLVITFTHGLTWA